MLGMDPHEENADWLRSTFPAEGEEDDQPKSYWFAIADPESDVAIGEIGLVGISWPNRRAGLSIFTLPASRRSGAGREAIELLVGWGQRDRGLHRIEIRTLPENVAMRALAQAAGFAYEGILRDYAFERGRFADHVVFARLAT
jgi:RimJ/RimL family protein N-acetyltransferase